AGVATTSPFTKFSVGGDAYIGGNLTATGTLTVLGGETITGNVSVIGTNNDASSSPAAFNVNGGFMTIGDAASSATLTNGTGIKFNDTGVSHASERYLSSADRLEFCGSSGNSVLGCTSTPTLSLSTLNGSIGGNVLIGKTTDNNNGRIQLADHTTTSGGITFNSGG